MPDEALSRGGFATAGKNMLRHIGASLGRAPAPPDRVPVRRHSHLVGRYEGAFWRRTDRREVRRVVLAARKYDLLGRQPERPSGPLGHVAIEALELLGNIVDFQTGRLEPAIAYLMRRLKRCRASIMRALAALRAHGFLDWLRRFERVERDGPEKPTVIIMGKDVAALFRG